MSDNDNIGDRYQDHLAETEDEWRNVPDLPQFLITEARDPRTDPTSHREGRGPVLVALPDTGTQTIREAWMVDERDQWWAELPRPLRAADALAALGLTPRKARLILDAATESVKLDDAYGQPHVPTAAAVADLRAVLAALDAGDA